MICAAGLHNCLAASSLLAIRTPPPRQKASSMSEKPLRTPHTLRISLFVAFVCCSLLSLSVQAEEPLELKILTWNIHHALGVDGRLDVERIAKVISACRPDIVALQEVDQQAARSNSVDQPAELSRLTGMQVAFGGNIPLQGGRYGNAVLSRFPILSSENKLLPNHRNGEQRGVMLVQIQLPRRDQPLTLLATHLDHRENDSERIASVRMINELLPEISTPRLLAGDLNAVPESSVLQLLRSSWRIAHPGMLPTVPVTNPSRQIDYILYSSPQDWEPVSAEVLPEAAASDHRAVLVTLRLQED